MALAGKTDEVKDDSGFSGPEMMYGPHRYCGGALNEGSFMSHTTFKEC